MQHFSQWCDRGNSCLLICQHWDCGRKFNAHCKIRILALCMCVCVYLHGSLRNHENCMYYKSSLGVPASWRTVHLVLPRPALWLGAPGSLSPPKPPPPLPGAASGTPNSPRQSPTYYPQQTQTHISAGRPCSRGSQQPPVPRAKRCRESLVCNPGTKRAERSGALPQSGGPGAERGPPGITKLTFRCSNIVRGAPPKP